MPRSSDIHPISSSFLQTSLLTPHDGTFGPDKPPKSKSFMSSLKHLTLPRRKHGHKDKHDNSMSSHASSITQLNTNIQSPSTNPVSHSFSSGTTYINFLLFFFHILNIKSLYTAVPGLHPGMLSRA